MSDEIDYETEYASLYQAVMEADLHIIDGPQGREVCMPLGFQRYADEFAAEIIRLRDRVKDLEDRLHERDLAVAALAQDRDEAYEDGVKDGIERVCEYVDHPDFSLPEQAAIKAASQRAMIAYKKEMGSE
jgi:hypothetical protein